MGTADWWEREKLGVPGGWLNQPGDFRIMGEKLVEEQPIMLDAAFWVGGQILLHNATRLKRDELGGGRRQQFREGDECGWAVKGHVTALVYSLTKGASAARFEGQRSWRPIQNVVTWATRYPTARLSLEQPELHAIHLSTEANGWGGSRKDAASRGERGASVESACNFLSARSWEFKRRFRECEGSRDH